MNNSHSDEQLCSTAQRTFLMGGIEMQLGIPMEEQSDPADSQNVRNTSQDNFQLALFKPIHPLKCDRSQLKLK